MGVRSSDLLETSKTFIAVTPGRRINATPGIAVKLGKVGACATLFQKTGDTVIRAQDPGLRAKAFISFRGGLGLTRPMNSA